jgi:CrcB protein
MHGLPPLTPTVSLWWSALAVGAGAALGAVLRWELGRWLNALTPNVPAGTLVANLIGGFGVGVAIALFAHRPDWPPQWRLFLITGFLGGLTTFSTFSAEVIALLQHGRWTLAAGAAVAHLGGSLLATFAGLAVAGWWIHRAPS